MIEKLLDYIRSRSQEQWQELALEKWRDLRIWLQENGELAFLAGMIFCFLLITFIKFFSALIAVAVIATVCAYHLALPEAQLLAQEQEESATSSEGSQEGDVAVESAVESDEGSEEAPLTH